MQQPERILLSLCIGENLLAVGMPSVDDTGVTPPRTERPIAETQHKG
jgi:hypothetical protein